MVCFLLDITLLRWFSINKLPKVEAASCRFKRLEAASTWYKHSWKSPKQYGFADPSNETSQWPAPLAKNHGHGPKLHWIQEKPPARSKARLVHRAWVSTAHPQRWPSQKRRLPDNCAFAILAIDEPRGHQPLYGPDKGDCHWLKGCFYPTPRKGKISLILPRLLSQDLVPQGRITATGDQSINVHFRLWCAEFDLPNQIDMLPSHWRNTLEDSYRLLVLCPDLFKSPGFWLSPVLSGRMLEHHRIYRGTLLV